MVHQQMMHENTTESCSARTVSLGTEAVSLDMEQSTRSGRTADRDDWEVFSSDLEVDAEFQDVGWFRFDRRLRGGTSRGVRPAGARLDAGLFVVRRTIEIHFVGRPTVERHVRTMLVEPVGVEA